MTDQTSERPIVETLRSSAQMSRATLRRALDDNGEHPIKTVVEDFGWVHTGLGTLGNLLFFLGSILFLPTLEPFKTFGVILFILGAGLMLVGSLGDLLVKAWEDERTPSPPVSAPRPARRTRKNSR